MPTLTTEDGVPLHLRHWPAADGSPGRGTVLIVHGLGEHIGRYAHVAQALNAAGWAVLGYDHRGHGASGGPRGAVPAPAALLRDLALVVDHARTTPPGSAPPPRLVLLGHSMGGLVVGRFVAEALAAQPAGWSRPVDGLIMSSPALDPGMNAFQKLLLAVLGPLAPNLAVGNGLNADFVSRDSAVVAAYRADPLVHDRITPALVRFIVDGGVATRAAAPRWRTPTLLLWAGADRLVAPAGSAAFAAAAPAAVVQARCLADQYHEIFNEPQQAATLAEVTAWLGRL